MALELQAGACCSSCCCTLAALAALLALAPVLDPSAEWIDDDAVNFRDSPLLKAPLTLEALAGAVLTPAIIGVYEPVALLVKQVIVAFLGLHPAAIKLVALALHALNAALATALALVLEPGIWHSALLASALVAAHPLRVEVVAWCSCLPYALAASLSLLATHMHLLALRRPRHRGVAEATSAMLLVAAVLSKAAALGLAPFLVFLDAQLWARQVLPFAQLRAALPWHGLRLLLTVLAGALAALADAEQPLPAQPPRSVLRAAYAVWFNLRLNLWPKGANTFYPPPQGGLRWGQPVLAAPVLLVAAATLAPPLLLWRRWEPRLAAAWAWWLGLLVLLAPTLGLAGRHLTGSLVHNRFTYIPSFLAFVPLLQQVLGRWGRLPALALLPPMLLHTWEYATAWNHGSTIGPRSVAVDPQLAGHLANKAVLRAVYFEESAGRGTAAEAVLRRVLQHVPTHGGACRNLGRILAARGAAAEAREVLERHVETTADGRAEWWLGHSLRSLGMDEEAEVHLQRALRLEPGHDPTRDQELMMQEAAEVAFHWH